jgi:hypothetical protein
VRRNRIRSWPAAALTAILTGLACGGSGADELVVAPALERNGSAEIAYRFSEPVTGQGVLDVEWSDPTGRIIDRRRISLDLVNQDQTTFKLDTRRAVRTKNRLSAHLSLVWRDGTGNLVHHEAEEAATFIATPSDRGWSDYQIIMWQGQTPAGYATLKKLGVTAGMLETNHRDESAIYTPSDLARLVDADLRCYLENITTDFYSPYHRWDDERPVNWRFLDAKQRYWANPRDRGAFSREPSLSDPQWLERTRARLTRSVQALHRYRPLYFSLGDETGIGDLAAFWDFDFSAVSLAAMRGWLHENYGSLAALNRQWGTAFEKWEEVMPMTTDEAIKRSDRNYSAWADFKEWMDVAFARAIKNGTDAVHAADRDAISAIEGAQIPGWGGYDYALLSGGVDAMELYDFGENIPIARSFNPGLIMLTTSSKSGPAEAHRVWRELLRGTRGLILWDEKNEFTGGDGNLGDRGRAAAPYFREIRGGIGALLINSRRRTDPVGILYSPASRRIHWLLDRRATGEDWSRRNASTEYEDDAIRTATQNFANALQHMGVQYRFVSSTEVREGTLREGAYRVLILPHAIALASSEAAEIRDFVDRGGVVIADGEPGLFDEHGRMMSPPLLSEMFPGPARRPSVTFAFGKGQAIYLASSAPHRPKRNQGLSEILDAAGAGPAFPILRMDGKPAEDVESYVFTNGEITIVALQRDYVSPSNAPNKESLAVQLPGELYAYDIRAQRALGRSDRVEVELDAVEPVLLSLSEQPLSRPSAAGPRTVHLGETLEFHIASGTPGARAALHIDVIGPDGAAIPDYSGNVLADSAEAVRVLPLAFNDETGVWKLHVRDLLSAVTETIELQVEP